MIVCTRWTVCAVNFVLNFLLSGVLRSRQTNTYLGDRVAQTNQLKYGRTDRQAQAACREKRVREECWKRFGCGSGASRQRERNSEQNNGRRKAFSWLHRRPISLNYPSACLSVYPWAVVDAHRHVAVLRPTAGRTRKKELPLLRRGGQARVAKWIRLYSYSNTALFTYSVSNLFFSTDEIVPRTCKRRSSSRLRLLHLEQSGNLKQGG